MAELAAYAPPVGSAAESVHVVVLTLAELLVGQLLGVVIEGIFAPFETSVDGGNIVLVGAISTAQLCLTMVALNEALYRLTQVFGPALGTGGFVAFAVALLAQERLVERMRSLHEWLTQRVLAPAGLAHSVVSAGVAVHAAQAAVPVERGDA